MKRILLMLLLNIPIFMFSQVVLNQTDDFEDYTNRNWAKNNTIPNTNIYDGGPLGVGDNFLRVSSSGTGNNLKLMTYNNAQWIGDYYKNNLSNRIKYITMDVRNSGTNVIFVRLSFGRYTSGNYTENWSAINAIAVLPGDPWKKISFYIDESAFVRVTSLSGTLPDFSGAFSSIGELRILHSNSPAWDSDPIIATLDIDNIQTRSTQLGTEDFQISNNLILYPNPSNDFFTIYSDSNLIDSFEYKIVDLLGRIVKSGNSKINQEVDVKDLNSGNYIIQVKTENGRIINQRLIKK